MRMGERLAREAPAEADLVIGIPDCGTPAAIGFSKASGIPFNEALIKNRYVARTFIQPEQGMREQGIRMKFNPLDEVEGQADRRRRRLDRPREHDAPARRRCSSTPARPRCTCASRRRRSSRRASTGSTWPTRTSSPPPTARSRRCASYIGATSLHYLSVEGMQEATTLPEDSVCRACFTRDYPTRVPPKVEKLRFEPAPA